MRMVYWRWLRRLRLGLRRLRKNGTMSCEPRGMLESRPVHLGRRKVGQGCQRRGPHVRIGWRMVFLRRNAIRHFYSPGGFQQHVDNLTARKSSERTCVSYLLHLWINIIAELGSLNKIIPTESSTFIRGCSSRVTHERGIKPSIYFAHHRNPSSAVIFSFRVVGLYNQLASIMSPSGKNTSVCSSSSAARRPSINVMYSP
ncbi:hypothetical protein BDV11DRAFT_66813 [Aspergillus similis]